MIKRILKKTLIISTCIMMLGICGCSKNNDNVATNTDAAKKIEFNESGWHIEDIDMDACIAKGNDYKKIVDTIDSNYTPYTYVGYSLTGKDNIKYAFLAFDKDENKTVVYVNQDDRDYSFEAGTYDDLTNIMVIPEKQADYINPSDTITTPGYEPENTTEYINE